MDFRAAVTSDPRILDALARLHDNPGPDLPVLSAKIKLLWHCNLSCSFCRLPEPRTIMTRAAAMALGRELAAQGLRKAHFSGGEVLLHPDCFAILADCAGLGVQVNLTSNGLLMGKEEIRLLEGAGVHSISLSIDSADRKVHDRLRGKKGSHKAVVRAAERIAGRGKIRVRINTVVTARNIRGLGDMRGLVRSFGPDVSWKLIPVDPVDPRLLPRVADVEQLAAEASQWVELEDRTPFGCTIDQYRATAAGRHGFRGVPCFAPWFHLFFTPEGFCYPCCMARGSTAPLGRFPELSVQQILEGGPMGGLRSLLASGGHLDVCARCDDFLDEGRIITGLMAGAVSSID
jgi:MoaA/NifB/PqqE/SkfB family radical SAM enzyme